VYHVLLLARCITQIVFMNMQAWSPSSSVSAPSSCRWLMWQSMLKATKTTLVSANLIISVRKGKGV
jgi:hypothetical protein